MRFLGIFTWIVAVSFTMIACADEGTAIAQDLTDLRQQLGSQHQSDTQAFQQAVRDVAKRNHGNREPTASWGQPTSHSSGNQVENRIGTQRSFGTPAWPGAHHPRHATHPAPQPATRLRETAFQLERLAHELEMTELYEGAEMLRDTAEKLRRSARQAGTVRGGPTPPPALTPHHHP